MNSLARVMFFVKAPVPGTVKTRLAASIGDQEAAGLYKAMAEDALAALDASGLTVEVHFAPGDQGRAVARWLGSGRRYVPQQGMDLGERMERAFAGAFSSGAARAVLVGSDIPELKAETVTGAFKALEEAGAVLAPAGDGGYTLIGFRAGAFAPRVFQGLPWGGPEVFEASLRVLKQAGSTVNVLPRLPDLDDLEDLRSLYARGAGRPGRTMAWLAVRANRLFGAMPGPGPACKT